MLLNKINILEIPRNLKNSEEWCVKVGSATNTEIATALTQPNASASQRRREGGAPTK